MKIEAGKYYRTRDGRKVGPMQYRAGFNHCWIVDYGDGLTWTFRPNGVANFDETDGPNDLIAEWTDEDGPTLSSASIDQIAKDSLEWHFAQGFDSDLEKEAFRIVLMHYGVRV